MYQSENGHTYLRCHQEWRWICRIDNMQLCYLQQSYTPSCFDRLWLDNQAWFVATQDPTTYRGLFVNGTDCYHVEGDIRRGILRAIDANGVAYVLKVQEKNRLNAEWLNMQLLFRQQYPLFNTISAPIQYQDDALLIYPQALPLTQAAMRGLMQSGAFRRQYLLPLISELHQLHLLGFVHGDLHNGNILLTPSGLKLIDFESMRPLADYGEQAETTNALYQNSWSAVESIRKNRLRREEQRVPDNHQEFRALGRLIALWLLPAVSELQTLFNRDLFLTTYDWFHKRSLQAWYELFIDWLFQSTVCVDTLIKRIEAMEKSEK
jgi:serine/threonine protein kinase